MLFLVLICNFESSKLKYKMNEFLTQYNLQIFVIFKKFVKNLTSEAH